MLKKVTPPTIDILDEIKAYLRVTDTDSDATITMLINSSLNFAENYTNRQFGVATFEFYVDKVVSGLCIPKTPIKSITKIEYMDENGDYQLLDSTLYYLYEEDGIGKIEFTDTLPTTKEHKYAWKITFEAGYEQIPELLMSWLGYRVMEQYDGVETPVNRYVQNVLDQFKVSQF